MTPSFSHLLSPAMAVPPVEPAGCCTWPCLNALNSLLGVIAMVLVQCNRTDTLARLHVWLAARYKSASRDPPRHALVCSLVVAPLIPRAEQVGHSLPSQAGMLRPNLLRSPAVSDILYVTTTTFVQLLYVKSAFMPALEEEVGALADVRPLLASTAPGLQRRLMPFLCTCLPSPHDWIPCRSS